MLCTYSGCDLESRRLDEAMSEHRPFHRSSRNASHPLYSVSISSYRVPASMEADYGNTALLAASARLRSEGESSHGQMPHDTITAAQRTSRTNLASFTFDMVLEIMSSAQHWHLINLIREVVFTYLSGIPAQPMTIIHGRTCFACLNYYPSSSKTRIPYLLNG